jgi:predicted phosphoribosyltransferase
MLGVSDAYIDEVSRVETAAAERELAAVRVAGEALDVEGRAVVLTDDGSATRWGADAAIAALRGMGVRRLILAVPVCSSDVRDLLARQADAVVCGVVPERDCGAGAHYADFASITNETVRRMLARPVGQRVASGLGWRHGARGDAAAGA